MKKNLNEDNEYYSYVLGKLHIFYYNDLLPTIKIEGAKEHSNIKSKKKL